MMKKVILLSQNFPPSTIASVHRARHMAKYLAEFGWEPLVLAVDERFHKEPPDPELAQLVPSSVKVIRVPAYRPDGMLRRLGIGDLSLRSWPFIRRELSRLLATGEYHAIFITGWPFYHMLMARWLRTRWKVPVILDFQDPWVSREGASRPLFSKGGLAHRLSVALEPHAVRFASFITSVSDTQNAEMAARYPWLDASRMAAIPIGGDPDDSRTVRNSANDREARSPDFTLSYVGTALPRSTPLLATLMQGLAHLRARSPAVAARIRLRFVGTSNQANGGRNFRVLPLAEAAGVADLVIEEPARVPYLDALRVLAVSDAVLMIGSDEAHYTASKIYPGMMSGRPFFSLFHRESSAHQILSGAGGGLSYAFGDLDELASLAPAMADGLERIATDPASLGSVDPKAYEPYTARNIAKRYAEIFDQVAKDAA